MGYSGNTGGGFRNSEDDLVGQISPKVVSPSSDSICFRSISLHMTLLLLQLSHK